MLRVQKLISLDSGLEKQSFFYQWNFHLKILVFREISCTQFRKKSSPLWNLYILNLILIIEMFMELFILFYFLTRNHVTLVWSLKCTEKQA